MYCKHFGFSKKPFDVTPDHRFLYQTPGNREALSSILYGIRERRGFVALVGAAGTGKTTLLRLLDLLEAPAAGRIIFDGKDVTAIKKHHLEVRRRMSFVQQKPAVFDMSVFDNVACGLKWRSVKSQAIK